MNIILHELLSSLLVGALYVLAFVVAEMLHRRRGVEIEMTRKLVHVLGGFIALLLPALFRWQWTVPLLGSLFALALILTRRTQLLDSVHRVERISAGEILYPVGVAATYLLATVNGSPRFFNAAVMTLALGDAAAGLVGSRWGRRRFRVFGDTKSVEGSATFFCTALFVVIVVLLLGGVHASSRIILLALAASLAGTLAELAAPRGSDNLAIPVVVWTVLFSLDHAIA